MELVTIKGATKRTKQPRSLTVEEFQEFVRHLGDRSQQKSHSVSVERQVEWQVKFRKLLKRW